MSWTRLLFEVASELWRERQQEKARQRAAEAWANAPAHVRACLACGEIAYTPGQTRCDRCGAELTPRPK